VENPCSVVIVIVIIDVAQRSAGAWRVQLRARRPPPGTCIFARIYLF